MIKVTVHNFWFCSKNKGLMCPNMDLLFKKCATSCFYLLGYVFSRERALSFGVTAWSI